MSSSSGTLENHAWGAPNWYALFIICRCYIGDTFLFLFNILSTPSFYFNVCEGVSISVVAHFACIGINAWMWISVCISHPVNFPIQYYFGCSSLQNTPNLGCFPASRYCTFEMGCFAFLWFNIRYISLPMWKFFLLVCLMVYGEYCKDHITL